MALQGFKTHIKSLIDRLGRDVIYRTYTVTGTDYNPTRTPVDVTVKAAIFNYHQSERDNGIIQTNDRKIAISAGLGVTITKQGEIVDGGVTYTLVDVEDVGPQAEVLMYVAQGRS